MSVSLGVKGSLSSDRWRDSSVAAVAQLACHGDFGMLVLLSEILTGWLEFTHDFLFKSSSG